MVHCWPSISPWEGGALWIKGYCFCCCMVGKCTMSIPSVGIRIVARLLAIKNSIIHRTQTDSLSPTAVLFLSFATFLRLSCVATKCPNDRRKPFLILASTTPSLRFFSISLYVFRSILIASALLRFPPLNSPRFPKYILGKVFDSGKPKVVRYRIFRENSARLMNRH